MSHKVLVIGGATWDVLFTTSQTELVREPKSRNPLLAFPYGGKVDAVGVTYGFGGGAANVAVGLARLGVRAGITTRVGDDWRGGEVVRNLRANGVEVNLIQTDRVETTPLAFIVTTGGAHDHVAFVSRGAATKLKLPAAVPKMYTWVYLTSLATPAWWHGLRQLLPSLKRRGQCLFWNPGAAQLAHGQRLKPWLRYVTVLDLNREEAELLAKDLKFRYRSLGQLLHRLKSLGSTAVLITDGARGAYYYDGTQVLHRPSLKLHPVNTTGAGDAFGAGFLAGYLRSHGNVRQAMDWGMCSSSSVIMHVGAQRGLLASAEIHKFEQRYAR